MSFSRSSSAEEIQKSESSTSIDINLENDTLLEEENEIVENNNTYENSSYINKYENAEPSFIDTLSNPGELLISSVKSRKQEQEFKETIITNSTNSFSFGFKNVDRIFPEKVELTSTKPLPEWLTLSLYILSPGRFDFDYTQQKDMESVNRTFTINHLFDGLPVAQKIDIKGNSDKVDYMSQLLSRKVERKIHENHGIPDNITGLWSNNTNQSAISRIFIQPLKSNKKITPDNNIIADNIIADFPSKTTNGTLATVNNTGNIRIMSNDLKLEKAINYIDINSGFKTSYSSPHPKIDPYTGKMINIVSEITLTTTKYKVISFDKTTSNVIAILNEKISPIHTFAITENYIVIISFPYKLKKAGLNYFTGDSLLSSFEFDPEGLTYFYVISKKSNSHIATFTTDPCFGLHIINSYETSKTIWIDYAIYNNDKIVHELTLDNLRKPKNLVIPSSKIIRFRLDLNEMDMVNQNLDNNKVDDNLLQASFAHFSKEIAIELPTINPRNIGRNYKYAYGIALQFNDGTPGKYYEKIKKINIETQQSLAWNEDHCYPCEPLFVPNSSDVHAPEDDGVVISMVYNGSKNESFLLILNAKDMTEIARITLPVPFPPSFSHSVAVKN